MNQSFEIYVQLMCVWVFGCVDYRSITSKIQNFFFNTQKNKGNNFTVEQNWKHAANCKDIYY